MQTIINKPLQLVWLKAAVLGSLWASVEIILGSFLHNLRIPFSGSSLAVIAVWLLVAFAQNWKDKGLIWRAGLIAALMKSISPSAVILGPMIGIFTEALIIELSIRAFGRNLPGYMIGGGLAVVSALMHKAVNLLILYGFDLVRVLNALFHFSAQSLRLEHVGLRETFFLLAIIYTSAGILAALAGYFSGKGMFLTKKSTSAQPSTKKADVLQVDFTKKSSELFARTSSQKYATPLLFLNILAVFAAMFLISSRFILPAAIFSAGYLAFAFFRYRKAVKRIQRFSFWIPFMLITLIAAVLLEGIDKGLAFSMDGFLIGIRMNVRAFVLITGFTAISTEMKNPTIRMILYNKGFTNLYQALNLSFAALPAVIAFISDKKSKTGLRRFSFNNIHRAAESLLMAFQTENKRKTPVIIITGGIGQGKTSFAGAVIRSLQKSNIPVSGFLSIGKQKDGQRTGFDLQSLHDNSITPLCTTEIHEHQQSFGKYYFYRDGLKKGDAILHPEHMRGKKTLVVDELGPLEINDLGWAAGIERILAGTSILQLWVVRKSLVQYMARKWDVGNVYIFETGIDQVEDVVVFIKREVL
jgi:nucleoside-triphosphatase THEP1